MKCWRSSANFKNSGMLGSSLGKQNTAEDVDFALQLVPSTVARLRELSPVYNRKQAISS